MKEQFAFCFDILFCKNNCWNSLTPILICLSTSYKLKKGNVLIFFSAWTKWRVIAIYNESEWWMKYILCNSHWGVKVRLLYIEEMCIYHFLFYEHMFNAVKWFLNKNLNSLSCTCRNLMGSLWFNLFHEIYIYKHFLTRNPGWKLFVFL